MRFSLVACLLAVPFAQAAPVSSFSLTAREPAPVSVVDILPRQEPNIDAIVDSLRDFIKETLSAFGLSAPPATKVKRQAQGLDLGPLADRISAFIKEILSNVDFNKVQKRQSADLSAIIEQISKFFKDLQGKDIDIDFNKVQKRQSADLTALIENISKFFKDLEGKDIDIDFSKLQKRQSADPSAIVDSISKFIKELLADIDFNTVHKRQSADLSAIIEQISKFFKDLQGKDIDIDFSKLQKRQAAEIDFGPIIDSLSKFLKELLSNVDFNKVQKRQDVDTDAIIDKLKDLVNEALRVLGLGGNKVKRQGQAGGLDLTATIDKLADFLKTLFENIDF